MKKYNTIGFHSFLLEDFDSRCKFDIMHKFFVKQDG